MFRLCARAHDLSAVDSILAAGFDALEITLPCGGGAGEERAWTGLAREEGLLLLGHGPNEGNPRDLAHLENRCLPQLRHALEAASRMGVGLLTIHFNLDSRWLPAETLRGKIDLLARVAGWGVALGVSVNLENLSEGSADLGKALREVPTLGLTLDLGHAMLTHGDSTAPCILAESFERITHLHVHDNLGGKSHTDDLHLIPGEGKVDFPSLFSMLKVRGFNRTATLELAPHELALGKARVEKFWMDAS